MNRFILTVAALFASIATMNATPIDFTWTAFALPDSTLNGQAFSGQITFAGVSDSTLVKPNPIQTSGQNFGFSSIGPVTFSIPSLDATGATPDTAFILSFATNSVLKFVLSPNGVNGDVGGLLLSNLPQEDLFSTSQTVSGSQFVEALGTAPVSSAVIGGAAVSNTSLFLDVDPNQNATFVETAGAPEPASWSLLLSSGLILLLAGRFRELCFSPRIPRWVRFP